ncbi:SipW-dependent-type signal peptide-containing protein [Speluncibacter jeojiensis]|uniref:SipW-dependent-type signal peptide-containing protein n=1 Tax=Speluncibacter jeojiensis TaxID=2710754 RepID=A0A9X4LXR5_9ACTN|nr:SipW-dependent-type signal peptide-containing protein [Corynebacteriales bacterium D3-21]
MSQQQEKRSKARAGGSGWTRTRAVLSLGMILGLGAIGTLAAWSDTATATTGTFTIAAPAKNVEMKVSGQRPSYSFTSLTASGMMPLDSTAATLEVQNTGDAAFTYTATANASGDSTLAPFLTVTAFSGATVAGSGNAKTCSGGTNIGSTTLQVGTSKPLITTGRPLPASTGKETVCVQVAVSNAVTKAASGKSSGAVIQFAAIGA